VISSRYALAACLAVVLALVPTVIHSYVGVVVRDELQTANIPASLAGFTSVPSPRDAGWGARRFESDDWFERRYLSGDAEVLLTVLRSYDLKRLYHHPELDIAYGNGYLSHEIIELQAGKAVPVHLLRTSSETEGTAVYALHYDGQFVSDPIWLQLRVAGELLFGGRKPMTLLFARDVGGAKGSTPSSLPSARILTAAIDHFSNAAAQR
jgi:hypothetical protein